jgi:hypothetical protein
MEFFSANWINISIAIKILFSASESESELGSIIDCPMAMEVTFSLCPDMIIKLKAFSLSHGFMD